MNKAMVRVLGLLLAPLALCGQSAPPSPAPPVSLPPAKWAGCGATFANPGWLGWCALAMPVVASQGVYSWTMYQLVPVNRHPPTVSTTTGPGIILRSFKGSRGTLDLLGIGAAGVAVTSSATTGAFSGGGVALWKAKSGWTFEFGFLENKAGASVKPQWIGGPGLTW